MAVRKNTLTLFHLSCLVNILKMKHIKKKLQNINANGLRNKKRKMLIKLQRNAKKNAIYVNKNQMKELQKIVKFIHVNVGAHINSIRKNDIWKAKNIYRFIYNNKNVSPVTNDLSSYC